MQVVNSKSRLVRHHSCAFKDEGLKMTNDSILPCVFHSMECTIRPKIRPKTDKGIFILFPISVCYYEQEIILWDIKTGQHKRKILGKKQCMKALFCCGDKLIACKTDKTVSVEEVETGQSANFHITSFHCDRYKHILVIFSVNIPVHCCGST
jgi:hypothetical protein